MFVREIVVKGNVNFLDWWKNKVDSYKKICVYCKVFFLYIWYVCFFRVCFFGYWEYCYENVSKFGF